MATPEPLSSVLEFLRTEDLASTPAKKALWPLLQSCGSGFKRKFQARRDHYHGAGLDVGSANRLAVLDIAAELPGAKDVESVLGSLRSEVTGGFEGSASAGSSGVEVAAYDALVAEVAARPKGGRVGIAARVAWIVEHIGLKVTDIDPDDVPSLGTLFSWRWAKRNETQFRKDFEAKTIPTRGISEDEDKGFIDSGEAIEDILGKLGFPIAQAASRSVQGDNVRHLQAADAGGDDAPGQCALHGVSGAASEGREGDSQGRAGGSGGEDAAEAGIGVRVADTEADGGVIAPEPGPGVRATQTAP